VPDHYDDGGLSGASLDRPALQALLVELRARKIDVVVVYEVDRLTRSLADLTRVLRNPEISGFAIIEVRNKRHDEVLKGLERTVARLVPGDKLLFYIFRRSWSAIGAIRPPLSCGDRHGVGSSARHRHPDR
jgi:hypothetical protein